MRQTDRQTETETETDRDRETKTESETKTETERDREHHRDVCRMGCQFYVGVHGPDDAVQTR